MTDARHLPSLFFPRLTTALYDAAAAMRRNVLLAAAAVYDDFSPLGPAAAAGGAGSSSPYDDACYSPSLECPSLSDLLMSSEEEDLLL